MAYLYSLSKSGALRGRGRVSESNFADVFLQEQWHDLTIIVITLCKVINLWSCISLLAFIQAKHAGAGVFNLVFNGKNGEPDLYISAVAEGRELVLTVSSVFVLQYIWLSLLTV